MKPILFNTEMVRAILDGRKSVTRRVVKPQPPATTHVQYTDGNFSWTFWEDGDKHRIQVPYNPGDILYVRETFRTYCGTAYERRSGVYVPFDDFKGYNYRADDSHFATGWFDQIEYSKWHPSIHMPKEAARLFLRVKSVRVERIQEIDYDGCKAEGIWDDYKTFSEKYHDELARRAYPVTFSALWNSTIRKADLPNYGWDANPWVWVIEFERVSKDEALCVEKRL